MALRGAPYGAFPPTAFLSLANGIPAVGLAETKGKAMDDGLKREIERLVEERLTNESVTTLNTVDNIARVVDQTFSRRTMQYPQGCESGKREFLRWMNVELEPVEMAFTIRFTTIDPESWDAGNLHDVFVFGVETLRDEHNEDGWQYDRQSIRTWRADV